MSAHLLDIVDLGADGVTEIVDRAMADPASIGRPLEGRGVALVFEKPSNRTRHSMEMAIAQLGGHPVYTRGEEVGIDVREPAEDIARVLAGYHAIIAARVFDHDLLTRMAAVSDVPVVNMLSDHSHPLQTLADMTTMRRCLGSPTGLRVAWVGDYNNVSRSLAEALVLCGGSLAIATPEGFGPSADELSRLNALGPGDVSAGHDPMAAVANARAVHTDTWISMGQEAEKEQRRRLFEGYTVDAAMMSRAADDAVFMHCLPAYRGYEVSAEVIDGAASRVVMQAHDRMHAARGALSILAGGL